MTAAFVCYSLEVSAILVSSPVRARAVLFVAVLIVAAYGCLNVLYAACIGIKANLCHFCEATGHCTGNFFVIIDNDKVHFVSFAYVLGVGNERQLVFLGVGRCQHVGIIQCSGIFTQRVVVLLFQGASTHKACVSEPSLLVLLLEGDVQYFLF